MIYRPLITWFGHNLLDTFQSDICQTFQFSPIIQKSHVQLHLITTAADELYSNSFTCVIPRLQIYSWYVTTRQGGPVAKQNKAFFTEYE